MVPMEVSYVVLVTVASETFPSKIVNIKPELFCLHGSTLKINDLYSYFNADKCKSLAGKPKMIFIQVSVTSLQRA